MSRLTRLSLAHRTVVMLLALLTIGLGVYSAGALKQELIPSMSVPQGAIVTVYPGASPAVVEAEKQVDPVVERDRAKEALTELFNQSKNAATHQIVERVVNDIDAIVKQVRFPDWQRTTQGERLVQKELRATLFKYKLHTDTELFEKAYAYIKEYY